MAKHFTAVNTLLVSTIRTKKGGFARVSFSLTSKITKALDWPEMPDGTAEGESKPRRGRPPKNVQ